MLLSTILSPPTISLSGKISGVESTSVGGVSLGSALSSTLASSARFVIVEEITLSSIIKVIGISIESPGCKGVEVNEEGLPLISKTCQSGLTVLSSMKLKPELTE